MPVIKYYIYFGEYKEVNKKTYDEYEGFKETSYERERRLFPEKFGI